MDEIITLILWMPHENVAWEKELKIELSSFIYVQASSDLLDIVQLKQTECRARPWRCSFSSQRLLQS